MMLRVAFGYSSGLVPVDGAVRVVLDLVHPPASDRLHTLGVVNQVPCLVFVNTHISSSIEAHQFAYPLPLRISLSHVLPPRSPYSRSDAPYSHCTGTKLRDSSDWLIDTTSTLPILWPSWPTPTSSPEVHLHSWPFWIHFGPMHRSLCYTLPSSYS